MQKQYFLTSSGQEVQFDDVNLLGQVSALADDVALSALLRVAGPSGSNPVRAVLPTYTRGASDNSLGTVSSGTGGVTVNPFWAIVGARTAGAPTDIRSACLAAAQAVPLPSQLAGAGTYRLDLVYATLYVDQNTTAVQRFKKDPTTGAVTSSNLPITKYSYVSVSSVTGVAGVSATVPALPSDPVGGFNIPLAIVRLENGFSGASVVTVDKIMDVSPAVMLMDQCAPANGVAKSGSPYWAGTSKSKYFVAASSIGESKVWGVLDTSIGALNGVVLDDSIDWRKRLVEIRTQTGAAGEETAWHSPSTSTALPATAIPTVTQSHTFINGTTDKVIFTLTNGGGTLTIYVDHATGALKTGVTGAPNVSLFFWLSATAQLRNT